ncbi:MAG: hypothetical protein K9G62_06770 [Alphaproteobacteria bacterium]|nr:hypothetical protein [Alphaproteobacteria bacterium]
MTPEELLRQLPEKGLEREDNARTGARFPPGIAMVINPVGHGHGICHAGYGPYTQMLKNELPPAPPAPTLSFNEAATPAAPRLTVHPLFDLKFPT